MIGKFLNSYGFSSVQELMYSLCPTFKYDCGLKALTFSSITAVIAEVIGITPALVVGMFVAVVAETLTGIYASHKLKIKFESWRFSRCILKVCIWIIILFILNCFILDAKARHGVLWLTAVYFYEVMQITTIIYFCIEYITSIAENLAIIDGKEKSYYIDTIKDIFSHVKTKLMK